MSEAPEKNLYAAPEAAIEVNQTESNPTFHVTGSLKVAIFYILSIGVYSIVWFYQQWRRQKVYAGVDCWPVPRAIFSVFFAFPLFTNIKEFAESKNVDVAWRAGALALLYLFSAIFINFSDALFDPDTTSALVLVIVFLSGLFVPGFILFVVQRSINRAYENELEDMNENFSLVNWIFIVVLVLFWGLGIYSLSLS